MLCLGGFFLFCDGFIFDEPEMCRLFCFRKFIFFKLIWGILKTGKHFSLFLINLY